MRHPEVRKADGAVARFCASVVREPLSFFNEGDLQGMIYREFCAAFPGLVPTGEARDPGSKARYRTPQVHREYGRGERARMDLVVLHEADLEEADRNLKVKGEYIDPMFGVELGTEKVSDIEGHIKGDIEKLTACWGRGYLIHFYRDVTKVDKGTKTWVKTQTKIQRLFKAPAQSIKLSENVRALFFIIELGGTRRRTRGKCKMYYPGASKWSPINTQKGVESAVKEALRGPNPG